MDEVESMKDFDNIFSNIRNNYQLIGNIYDEYNINFDCLKTTIDYFEDNFKRFTDYGLIYVDILA